MDHELELLPLKDVASSRDLPFFSAMDLDVNCSGAPEPSDAVNSDNLDEVSWASGSSSFNIFNFSIDHCASLHQQETSCATVALGIPFVNSYPGSVTATVDERVGTSNSGIKYNNRPCLVIVDGEGRPLRPANFSEAAGFYRPASHGVLEPTSSFDTRFPSDLYNPCSGEDISSIDYVQEESACMSWARASLKNTRRKEVTRSQARLGAPLFKVRGPRLRRTNYTTLHELTKGQRVSPSAINNSVDIDAMQNDCIYTDKENNGAKAGQCSLRLQDLTECSKVLLLPRKRINRPLLSCILPIEKRPCLPLSTPFLVSCGA